MDSAWHELSRELTVIRQEALNCTRCHLRSQCRQVVFDDGNPASPLMLIGEGPGEQEDIQGKPFVGRAGQLLDRILLAIGLDRQDVYITNVVKCRPPGNRTPTAEEAESCWPWLAGQLEVIQPELIVCLGLSATRQLTGATTIGQVRGKWMNSLGFRIMPTYHPAALLRNPSLKRASWEDFQKVRDELIKLNYPFRQEVKERMAKELHK